jgi:hypothetical protein
VARVLPTALVLALLAATAAAFALTERAKLELSPIYGTQQAQVFSPDSKVAAKKFAHIRFHVRKSESIDVWIQSSDGKRVDNLLVHRAVRPRELVQVVWDAFTPSGVGVPDGTYRAVVKLERSHRTIVLPSDIKVDTTPPRIVARPGTKYPIISPDGDGHADVFRVPYEVSEPAHAILLLRGEQVVFTNGQKEKATLVWNGKVPGSSRSLAPGRYVLKIAAQDRAGSRSTGVPFAIAQVRYVTLGRTRVVVRPGGRFALRVSTDAPRVDWRLHGRSGTLARGTLHLRAPRTAGVFRLYVTVGSHSAVCAVVVA